jgi:hypothetical protein
MSQLTRIEETLNEDVRRRLLAMRNVTNVGPGFKTVGGVITNQLAIVVDVERKLPRRGLGARDRVPPMINGVPTDVQPELDPRFFRPAQQFAADSQRVRPLRSGISISTTGSEAGTAGFYARRNSDQAAVLVSNYHVFYRGRGMLDASGEPHEVFQPPVGENNKIGKVVDGDIGGEIDAGIATLDEEGSSCCCMSTIGHENIVDGTLKNGQMVGGKFVDNRPLTGITRAKVGDIVTKTGRSTGPTVGKIVSVTKSPSSPIPYTDFDLPKGDSFTFTNLIMVVAWDLVANDFTPNLPFSDYGDSGSALVVEDKIVGLHFLGYHEKKQGKDVYYAFGCHVKAVEDKLKITVPGTRDGLADAGGGGAMDSAIASLDVPIDPGEGEIMIGGARFPAQPVRRAWAGMEARLKSTEAGRAWFDLFARHHYEVMALVNHRRPVTIAWQRGKGPAWMAAIVRSATHPDYRLPDEVLGSTMAALTAQIRDALAAAGDEALVDDLARHSPALRGHLCAARSAWELIDRLCATPLARAEPVLAEARHG